MKKNLILMLTALIAVACTQSPEKKAQKLAEEKIKNTLYLPETYEHVETEVDSAFYPKDSPELYAKVLKICKIAPELEQYNHEIEYAKSSMSLWSGPYMTSYGRNEYNEAKEKFDKNTKLLEEAQQKAQKLILEIGKMAQSERKFIGYNIKQKYRAKNNAGNTLMGKHLFLVDEKIEKIIDDHDMDSEEYQIFESFIEKWNERAEEYVTSENKNDSCEAMP
ncbi:MAG: hypothetical protein J5965_20420 [Aeriscardovia sp.]|nr:hypothetical protein [Aeriscardovia sp.]